MEDKFGEAKLNIDTANVICGEATWSLLIKMAFGRFNQLVCRIGKLDFIIALNIWRQIMQTLKETTDNVLQGVV